MVLQKPWVSQNVRRNSRVSQSRFLTVMCVSQSRSFCTDLSRRIGFFKAKKAARHRFVYNVYMSLNNVGTAQAHL